MKQAFYLGSHDYVALCDLLKLAGVVDSGGRAKHVIASGEVTRNGVVETRKTAKIHVGETVGLGDVVIQVFAGSHE